VANAPLRRCSWPGCTSLIRSSRCPKHSSNSGTPKNRPGDPFYTSRRWRKLRAAFLQAFPLCADCERDGRVGAANEVHHKQPRLEYPELAYEWSNLESLCKSHHSKHSAQERRGRGAC
jgi:5-methylcytosine-specific restriction protein A